MFYTCIDPPVAARGNRLLLESMWKRIKRFLKVEWPVVLGAFAGVAAMALIIVLVGRTSASTIAQIVVASASVVGLFALVSGVLFSRSGIERSRLQGELETQREMLHADLPPLESIRHLLEELITTERIDSTRAYFRSSMLFWIGVILLMGSLVAPIAGGVLYAQVDPQAELEQLTNALGANAANVPAETLVRATQRDWHVLLAGLSLGFLLLAAAGGILQLEARLRQRFARVSTRVGRFERVVKALEIVERVGAKDVSDDERHVVARTIDLLMSDSKDDPSRATNDSILDERIMRVLQAQAERMMKG